MGHYSLKILADRLGSQSTGTILEIKNTITSRTFINTASEVSALSKTELEWFKARNFSLDSLSFNKEMYKPGCISFKLQVTKSSVNDTQYLTNIKDLRLALMERAVMLDLIDSKVGDNLHNIARHYYIFEITPKISSNLKTGLYLEINAYSPDKYLALNNHCASYTGKTPSEILKLAVGSFKAFTIAGDKPNIYTNLRHLSYKENDENREYILPYVVQYNESTHDFLTRTANRYGEFLYYEDQTLNLGLKEYQVSVTDTSQIVTSITNYVQITNECSVCDSYYQDAYSSYLNPEILSYPHHNVPQSARASDELINRHRCGDILDTVYSDSATDEYLAPLTESEFYKSTDFFVPGLMAPKLVASSFSEPNLAGMMLFLGKNYSIAAVSAETIAYSKNKEFCAKITGEAGAKKEGIIYNDNKQKTNLGFCSTVRLKAKQASAEKIHIEIGSNVYKNIGLGSMISVTELGSTKYMIVAIKGSELINNDANTSNSLVEITAIPTESTASATSTVDTIYPYSLDTDSVRRSSSQKAVVIDNVDPSRMNRVRIRYPWQPQKPATEYNNVIADASPWIRLAMPMASAGHGFNFLPEIGDEVIVNYEGGNIERPYIEGSVYTKKRNALLTQEAPFMKTITSTNGHRIKFYDNPAGSTLVAKTQSCLSLVNSFIPGYLETEDPIIPKELAGYTEITDTYGLYSVKMSTEDRQVSISSPFGDVVMSALSGISLIAPNGNIMIKGKNVSIEAGNNLNLVSGKNIVTDVLPTSTDLLKKVAFQTADFLAKQVIDLSLIRTVIEVFLRPVGGTMLIKSNRYICMEAGKGRATILNPTYKQSMSSMQFFTNSIKTSITKQPIHNDVYNALQLTRDFLKNLDSGYGAARSKYFTYEKRYNALRTSNVLTRLMDNIITPQLTTDMIGFTIDASFPAKVTKASAATEYPIKEATKELIQNNEGDKQLADMIQELCELKAHLIQCDEELDDDTYIVNGWRAVARGVYLFEPNLANFFGIIIAPPRIANGLVIKAVYAGKSQDVKRAAYRAVMAKVLKHTIEDAVTYGRPNWVNYAGIMDFANTLHLDAVLLNLALSPLQQNAFNAYWEQAINNLAILPIAPLASNPVKDFVVKNSGFAGFIDQNVWDQANHGEIIFSNKINSTLHFNANGLEPFQPADYGNRLGQIKALMTQI